MLFRSAVLTSVRLCCCSKRGVRCSYQTLPGILIQESHCDIESRTSPHLQRVCIRKRPARLFRNIYHIDRPQARRKKRLVCITPSSVHDETAWVLANGLGKGFGTLLDDDVAPTDFARHGSIQWWTILVFPVDEFWYDNVIFETRFTLRHGPQFSFKIKNNLQSSPVVL